MALSDDDRAALSAYLDGELDDEATHRIEVRLTSEPELRFEYETLRQTWSLLDFLPRSSPSVEFTNRTLAQITLERHAGGPTWMGQVLRRVPVLAVAWASGILVAASVGVALGGWLTAPPNPDATIDTDEELVRVRDREWMKKQPKALQNQFAALSGDAAREFVQKLRDDDLKRHAEWAEAARFWNAAPSLFIAELAPADNERVSFLVAILSEDEKRQLVESEGKSPDFPKTLVALSDKYPLALPTKQGPRTFGELPLVLQERFKLPVAPGIPNTVDLIRKFDNAPWPRIAIQAAEINRKNYMRVKGPGALPYEIWACNYKCLLKRMQTYVDDLTLLPDFTAAELALLNKADGNWPDYPNTINKLAKDHKRPPPPWATALTGSTEPWHHYRAPKGNDQITQAQLEEFVFQLTPAERKELKINLHDKKDWNVLTAKFREAMTKKFGNGPFPGHDRERERERDRKKSHRD
jgi:hypothetical protein